MSHYDIAVAGAGLTGLALAAALRDSGLTIVLLDVHAPTGSSFEIKPEQSAHVVKSGVPVRVSAINQRSMAFLTRIAGAPVAAAPYSHMHVWDQMGSAQIAFDAADAGCSELGFIVPNSAMSNVLVAALEAAADVDIRTGEVTSCNRQDGAMCIGLAEGDAVTADLVIGADGASSAIRRMAGLRTFERNDGQRALVTTVMLDRSLEATAHQCFTEAGPLALLPVSGEYTGLASVVWSAADAEVERLLALDPATFCAEMSFCIADEVGEVVAVDDRNSFPLCRQFTPRFVRQGVVLAGDAAHAIHPLGGQGVNLGFADVEKLAELTHAAVLAGEALGDGSWLREYAFERGPYNAAVAAVMEAFSALYGGTYPALVFLRNRGMRLTNDLPFVKTQIARLASGLI